MYNIQAYYAIIELMISYRPKKTIYVGADSQAKDVTITLPFAPVAKVMRGNVYSSCNISRVVFTQV